MQVSDSPFTPREMELMREIDTLADHITSICHELKLSKKALEEKTKELDDVRRKMITLNEENQRIRENTQALRERVSSALRAIDSL